MKTTESQIAFSLQDPSTAAPAVVGWWAHSGAIALGIFLLVWLIYGQTLFFDFVNFDDDQYVTVCPPVQNGLTREGFVWAWQPTSVIASNWHTVTKI